MSKEQEEFWFKPKRHGYGAVPTNWKGVLATSAFAILLPLVSVPWLLSLSQETRLPGFIVWALAMLYAVWNFTKFAKRKTDGEWLWRHNGKPYRDMLDEKAEE
ncbi:MAG: hypothetical protein KJ587_07430 [Alphaproteobacteria bacterium]|nr:hypothetical protein [Alphaproteobacteria bacterium]